MPAVADAEQAAKYYYADGEKIPLELSTHFVALRTDDAESVASSMSSRASNVHEPAQVFALPDLNLVVLAVEGNGAAPQAAAMAGTEAGPTVYEAAVPDYAAQSEALIDIGEVIVKMRDGASESDREKLFKKHRLDVLQSDYPEPGAFLLKTAVSNGSSVDIANALHEEEAVDYAAPNFVRLNAKLEASNLSALMDAPAPSEAEASEEPADAGPAFTPNDPAFASQWGLHKIRAPLAWDISRGNPGISIAIVDEGGAAHEDYVLAPGWDARFNDPDPTPNPADGHGTACAGIAAASANNGRGGAGVAPDCKIRHIRIAYGIGGGYWSTTDAIIAAGVRKAVDLGADVLSNSFGSGPSTAVTNAFKYAQTNGRGGKGAPCAAATGNGDVGTVGYPARLSPDIRGFMAVGSSNQWDQRKSRTSLDGETWWGSNYGPQVDVVAPGVKIYTTDIMGSGGYSSGNYTPTFNGTSSATPHVAGLMALILSVDPDLRSWEVEEIIKMTARDLGSAGRDNHFGFGRIDARAALEAASKIWYQFQVTPVFLGAGRECFIRVNIRMYNPGINTVRLNGLTFRSHTPTGGLLDQFIFQPNPGPVLQPRSGHEVRFRNVLLRANGNQSSWSFRWSANWGYTYWRPSAPVLPLGASEVPMDGALDEAFARTETSVTVEGQDQGSSPTFGALADADSVVAAQNGALPGHANAGDSVTIDRAARTITVVIR